MSHRDRRLLFWMFFAVVALQNYVVRELLAGLLLIAVVVAGLTILVASAIIVETA